MDIVVVIPDKPIFRAALKGLLLLAGVMLQHAFSVMYIAGSGSAARKGWVKLVQH